MARKDLIANSGNLDGDDEQKYGSCGFFQPCGISWCEPSTREERELSAAFHKFPLFNQRKHCHLSSDPCGILTVDVPAINNHAECYKARVLPVSIVIHDYHNLENVPKWP